MNTTFEESTIPVNLKQQVFTKFGFDIDEDIAKGYVNSLFTAINEFMKLVRSEKNPVLFEVTSLKGDFLMAAIIRYESAADPSNPGNWNYSMTFNKEDTNDIATRYLYTDPQFGTILSNTMFNLYNYIWNIDSATGNKMTIAAIESIRDFLDVNAKDGEEVVVESPLFVAKVGIEDGEKVFSIIPGEKAKEKIKEPKNN